MPATVGLASRKATERSSRRSWLRSLLESIPLSRTATSSTTSAPTGSPHQGSSPMGEQKSGATSPSALARSRRGNPERCTPAGAAARVSTDDEAGVCDEDGVGCPMDISLRLNLARLGIGSRQRRTNPRQQQLKTKRGCSQEGETTPLSRNQSSSFCQE